MFEALVSSRIRRALLEYIVTHPKDRFYLRGLAKELDLSVSPLRRELKRLEKSGMLRAEEEGNMRFYAVQTENPTFQELLAASEEGLSQEAQARSGLVAQGSGQIWGQAPSEPVPAPNLEPRRFRSTVLAVSVTFAMACMLVLAGLLYSTITTRKIDSHLDSFGEKLLETQKVELQAQPELRQQPKQLPMTAPQTVPSGAMRGGRWQLIPGEMGGFSDVAAPASGTL